MTMLSAHFSEDELRCPCCHVCTIDAKLLIALEDIRDLVGPLTVLSGYRCEKHNKAVGGQPKSEHTQGIAADVTWPGIAMPEAYEAAEKVASFKNGGIGLYKQEHFIHVDVRGRHARWARVDGKYVGVEAAL